MINALEIPSDIDLGDFSRFLQVQGLPHRITEEGINQVVWVQQAEAVAYVQAAYARYQAGELPIGDAEATQPQFGVVRRLWVAVWRYPITMLLIALCLMLFPVGMNRGDVDPNSLFAQMMFLSLVEVNGDLYFASLRYTLEQGEFWRLLTPMFVHFSWLHIVFNLLWVWEIGRRIEYAHGGPAYVAVILVASVGANLLQFLMASPGFFGGMSGVVFGLLGHSLVFSRLVPARSMGVANGVYIFMLIYLAIGFTGAVDLLGLGSLANGAHLGGLIGGLITGALAGFLARSSGSAGQPPRTPPHSS